MFKNLTLFRIAPSWAPMESGLQAAKFAPCGPTQQKSVGWVPPRGEAHGALLEPVAGQRIMCLRIETRTVPASVVRKRADEDAARIETETGRKPGKKETKALREDALLALLPQAFPKATDILVWVDPASGLLAIDSTSQGKVDDAITALVTAFSGLSLSMVQTKRSPKTEMLYQLSADAMPDNFIPGTSCELVGEDGKSVRFKNHEISDGSVGQHIAQGKDPVWLEMDYKSRVSFVLTENLAIKKIKFLNGVMNGRDANEADIGFDADVALATGELRAMIAALIEALGGELP